MKSDYDELQQFNGIMPCETAFIVTVSRPEGYKMLRRDIRIVLQPHEEQAL
jgi:hypothetical protein